LPLFCEIVQEIVQNGQNKETGAAVFERFEQFGDVYNDEQGWVIDFV